jgi:7-cyano-7-deazaguanine synthase
MKIVAIVSGGMDSTTLLYHMKAEGHRVSGLGFNYGQRHLKELDACTEICAEADIPFEIADISAIAPLIAGQSSQVNPAVEVPEGHYTEDSMKATVVPNRNMIMLSIAIGHAIATESDAVAYGAHAGDHTIYPDCREEFAAAMARAARLCDWRPVELLRPFVSLSKADIAARGHKLGVPFEKTWSCYKGQELHCGKCGTCVERREAFELAGLEDPTRYQE